MVNTNGKFRNYLSWITENRFIGDRETGKEWIAVMKMDFQPYNMQGERVSSTSLCNFFYPLFSFCTNFFPPHLF